MTYQNIINAIIETLQKDLNKLNDEAKEAERKLIAAENHAQDIDSDITELQSVIEDLNRLKGCE